MLPIPPRADQPRGGFVPSGWGISALGGFAPQAERIRLVRNNASNPAACRSTPWRLCAVRVGHFRLRRFCPAGGEAVHSPPLTRRSPHIRAHRRALPMGYPTNLAVSAVNAAAKLALALPPGCVSGEAGIRFGFQVAKLATCSTTQLPAVAHIRQRPPGGALIGFW
jgi:hypothetical protein